MFKSVTIKIPYDENLPIKLFEFTPEKVLLAINVGYKCVLDAEQSMLGLTEEMIYNKVKEETNGEIRNFHYSETGHIELAEEMKKLLTNIKVPKRLI